MEQVQQFENLDISKIDANPENPRLFFRRKEMDDLKLSIEKNGLLQPISVYKDGGKFFIIDGERRWRTCTQLRFVKIPALIEEKPSPLKNLLMMFNIHGLREQWDIFTIAMKIERVIDLLTKKNKKAPTERELNEETGMAKGVIRRSKMIIALPIRFKRLLQTELEKPKNDQRFSEDFFIEMENSLRAVKNNFPETIKKIDAVRDRLIDKYLEDTIKSVTEFRKLTKIATAPKNTSYSQEKAKQNLQLIFSKNKIGIEEVYKNSVEGLYGDKKLISTVNNLYIKLSTINKAYVKSDQNLRETLEILKKQINALLK